VATAVLAAALLLLSACGGGSLAISTPTQPAAVGDESVTPEATEGATPTSVLSDLLYTVQDGDTLSAIADRFSVSAEIIAQANFITDPADLHIGDVLTIPGIKVTPQPSHTPPPVTTDADSPIGIHMAMPVAGACLTLEGDQMPNAVREYRNGIHEGVDFFTDYACVPVSIDTPALAAADGVVIRADKEYRKLTQKEIDDLEAKSVEQGYTDEGTLDKFRGRQVWVDHGDGIVTRYCHLNGVPDDIQVGSHVKQGDAVGYIGDSGTPESASNPEFEIHLHFEIRVRNSYLAAGLGPLETRNAYEQVFGFPLSSSIPVPPDVPETTP
jgi:murein DD-endopeptidase MepM/ murein hydrolase activator NlpD